MTVIERGPSLGGLAGTFDFGGHEVDRFYHVITPSDQRMIAMAEEVGLGDQLRFTPVGAGFFSDGEMHDFNGIGDLLRFSPLSPPARLRLGLFVAQCQLRSSYEKLETIPLETWLRRICGNQVWERIWKPLLDTRFDGDPSGLPATYLWARTRRMSGARQGKGQRRRGNGPHRRRPPAPDRRDGGAGARARGRGADRRAGQRARPGRGRLGHRRRAGGRDARVRPDDPDPAAARPCASCFPSAISDLLRALSRALARRRLPDRQGAAASCSPTTRSTSPSRRR